VIYALGTTGDPRRLSHIQTRLLLPDLAQLVAPTLLVPTTLSRSLISAFAASRPRSNGS
jgi:hypothetical protein